MVAIIPNSRTFVLRDRETSYARNIVTYDADETITLAMDFADVINSGVYLSSIDSTVTVDADGADAGSSTNATVAENAFRVEWNPPALVAGGYVVTVTVTTSDSETMVGIGILQVT